MLVFYCGRGETEEILLCASEKPLLPGRSKEFYQMLPTFKAVFDSAVVQG